MHAGVDPPTDRAREEAEGVEVFGEVPDLESIVRAREEAQGIEVFDDPDAAVPADAVRNGAPGEDSLAGGLIETGLGVDEEQGPPPDE